MQGTMPRQTEFKQTLCADINGFSLHAAVEANCVHHRAVRLSWTRLLKRVFELDLAHCPNCGSELKIIAAILEQPVIEKILTHLGLQARAPPRAPARGQALQTA